MTMRKILLVEDDPVLATTLKTGLLSKNFYLTVSENLEKASCELKSSVFEMILLDVNLPDGCGIQFCRSFRSQNKTIPIIMVTANEDEDSVVKGINSGADDYLRKPFGLKELAARMSRLLARESIFNLSFGPLKMDINKRQVFVNSQPLSLAKKEFQILQILVQKQGDIVSRDQIIHFLGDNKEIFDRTIDSHLSHLRRKFKKENFSQVHISPVYGVGYRLELK